MFKTGVVTSEDDEEFKDQGRTKSKIVNKTFKTVHSTTAVIIKLYHCRQIVANHKLFF